MSQLLQFWVCYILLLGFQLVLKNFDLLLKQVNLFISGDPMLSFKLLNFVLFQLHFHLLLGGACVQDIKSRAEVLDLTLVLTDLCFEVVLL